MTFENPRVLSTGAETGEAFDRTVEEEFARRMTHGGRSLKIGFAGKPSTGKSSLMNAFLGYSPAETRFAVGPTSGTTDRVIPYPLNSFTVLYDLPGINDVDRGRNSIATDGVSDLDVLIFVVSGSAEESQRNLLERFSRDAKHAIVVLNKVDQWDDFEPVVLSDVLAQWRGALGVSDILPTCAKGYDPRRRAGIAPDLRGIDELRDRVMLYLREQGIDHLLSISLAEKREKILRVIMGAASATAAQALFPGSGAYITATQAAAIGTIYFIYTGKLLTRTQALSVLPAFAAQAAGSSLFLLAKSFLPPTGIVDAAAAVVASSITAAMLLTVDRVLATGHELNEREIIAAEFKHMRTRARDAFGQLELKAAKDPGTVRRIVKELMYG